MFRHRKGRQLIYLALSFCVSLFLTGCRKPAEPMPAVTINHEVAPQPVKAGPATITIGLVDAAGNPLTGARVKLEGNMSHPGMSPVFGEANEFTPGRYRAPLEFTMGGDWVILVHITLPDGQKLERQFEVNSVQAG